MAAASGSVGPTLRPATKFARTTVTGRTLSLRVKVDAKTNSFQESTKTNAPVANTAGAASGRITCKRIWGCRAPSTLAASSTSTGNSRKKVASSQIANGRKKMVCGMMVPRCVPASSSSLSCTSIGARTATGGKKAIASMAPRSPLP